MKRKPESAPQEQLDAPGGPAALPGHGAFYKELLDNLYDGVYFVDPTRHIIYWNKGAERITGFPSARVIGHTCADNLLMHVDDTGTQLCNGACPLLKTIQDGQPREAEVYLYHAEGHRVPVIVRVCAVTDAAGQVVGAVETFSDNSRLTAERQRAHSLEETTQRDTLTGIGNREHVEIRLRSLMFEAADTGVPFGVLFMDIDHFKEINDSWGHAVGDQVLQMVAATLQHNLRSGDGLGRFGGEEFVAIVCGVSLAQLAAVAHKLRALVAQSRLPADGPAGGLGVTISVGAALTRPDDNVDMLLERADQLMYRSKELGRNCVSASE